MQCTLQVTGMPFYPAIGDHDHCQNTNALVEYTQRSQHWRLPSHHHTMDYAIPSGGSAQAR